MKMRTKKEIEQKYKEIEMQVINIRDMSKDQREAGGAELDYKHNDLTEQMATLRWVLSSDWEWDEPGIRDT
jgi:hypothetical protein